MKYSRGENWGVIPRESRDTRATLIAAANAYEDIFFDNSVKVPWGTPCNRLEGGMRSGKGTAEDTCNSGVPSGMKITNRRFVVDPEIGAVVVLSRFSNNELPDSHLFRLENGKIRFVHTLTVCTIPGCDSSVQPSRRNRIPSQLTAHRPVQLAVTGRLSGSPTTRLRKEPAHGHVLPSHV